MHRNLFAEIASQEKLVEQSVFIPVRSKKQIGTNMDASERVSLVYKKYPQFVGRCSFFIKQVLFWTMFARCYSRTVDGFDFIHAHTLYSDGFLAYFLNLKYGVPYAITVRATDLYVFEKLLLHWKWLTKKVLRNSKHVIFFSEKQKRYLLYKYGNNVSHPVVIPNGVDPFWVDNAILNKNSLNIQGKMAIYIGNLNRNKNIKNAITAFFKASNGEKSRFIVIGGTYQDYLKVYGVLPAALISKVDFLGKIFDKQVLKNYLLGSSVLIMASYMETFGLVYLEAISQCTPVVYSKLQGFDGVFPEGQVGYSCDSKDINSIRDAIGKVLIAFPDGLDFSNTQKNPVVNYSWERIASKYFDEVFS